MITFGTNTASLMARRQLETATSKVSKISERLASGTRINRASDDAAGLSISSSLDVSSRVQKQGILNINDGLSLTAIVTSALTSLQEISIRQRELTEQAANGVYSTVQRNAMQEEHTKLTAEYNRVIQTTTFNGLSLLDDPNKQIVIQVGGSNAGGQLALTLASDLAGPPAPTASGEGSAGIAAITGLAGTYFTINNPAGNHYVWFTVDGGGADPAPSGAGTGYRVDLTSADTSTTAAQAVATTLSGTGQFTATNPLDGIVRATAATKGTATDATAGTSGLSVMLSQQGVRTPYAISTGTYPKSVVTGDFNQDGKVDFATADSGSDRVTVFLGNGDTTFAAGANYSSGASSGPRDLATADLNSDGKPDLVVASSGSGRITVLMNNGNGTFAAKVDYSAPNSPTAVATADLNGDNKPDIVTALEFTNKVGVFMNNGDGTFAGEVDYSITSLGWKMALADFNNDNKLDIVASNWAGGTTASVLMNNGDGTFAPKVDYTTGSSPYGVATGDFNSDGKVDFVTADYSSNQVSVLINNGDGTFAAKASYATDSFPQSVAVGDYNGDGKLDLAVANLSSNEIDILLNNGDGTFAAKISQSGYGASPGQAAIASGDFNGDGKPDLVVSELTPNKAYVFINDGTANFTGAAESAQINFNTSAASSSARGLTLIEDLDLTTSGAALSSMTEIDNRMDRIKLAVGNVGALESRLHVALDNLQTTRENYIAARSRIIDADIAEESASSVNAQIGQNAAISILAQTNQSSSVGLRLLQTQ